LCGGEGVVIVGVEGVEMGRGVLDGGGAGGDDGACAAS
jgi:hypothetical protein